MPSGVALHEVRGQLFAAAEEVLRQEGVGGLTSRAVTAQAGCAKGVLHRHFTDFDAFLAELVEDRIQRFAGTAEELRAAVGGGAVTEHVTRALGALLDPVAVAVVALVTARDGLRARLRRTRPAGIPLLSDAAAVLVEYLAAERAQGRLRAEADVEALAPTLVGAAHLLFADRESGPPTRETLGRAVATVLAGSLSAETP